MTPGVEGPGVVDADADADDEDDGVPVRIADDDGDTSSDADPCERCACPRDFHADGKGECTCGDCPKFR